MDLTRMVYGMKHKYLLGIIVLSIPVYTQQCMSAVKLSLTTILLKNRDLLIRWQVNFECPNTSRSDCRPSRLRFVDL